MNQREIKLIGIAACGGALIALLLLWGFQGILNQEKGSDGFELLGTVPLGSSFAYEYQAQEEAPVEKKESRPSPQLQGRVAGVSQSQTPLFGIFNETQTKEEGTESEPSQSAAKRSPEKKTAPKKAEPLESSCSYADGSEPAQKSVIFNEINWAGSKENSNQEWIEMKNISSKAVDLSVWLVVDLKEQIRYTIPEGLELPPGALYLIKRGEDTLPDLNVPLYTGALSNSNEGLKLFNKNCGLEDFVEASPNWPAGESSERRSMERAADLSWYTNSSATGSSPGKSNSPKPKPQSAPSEEEELEFEEEIEEESEGQSPNQGVIESNEGEGEPSEEEESSEEESEEEGNGEEEESAEEGNNSSGQWYVSSHHSSKYYYCEESSGWKTLSETYLKIYASEEELLADFPNHSLHSSCQ